MPTITIELTNDEWTEIYYAVRDKRHSPEVVNDRKWKACLITIMEKLGPDGENAWN